MEFDANITGILLAYAVLIVGQSSPGPAVLGIIGTALERGRKPALWFASGVICGSATWGIAAALGMSAVLVRYANALYLIKIIGGLYLLWLAWKSLISVTSTSRNTSKPNPHRGMPRQMWLAGLLLHLTNPKAVIGWIATIALGVTPTSPAWVSFVIVLGGILFAVLINFGYALLFSTSRMTELYLKARKPIAYLFSALFGLAGLKLLTSRV